MGFYYFDYTYFLFMLPALLISMVAQFKVNSTFQKYSRVNTARNMTGADAAMRVMQYGGAYGVQIRHIGGSLNDNFNPSTGIISLSDPVYAATSVSAVGVAAHEAGHAVCTYYLPTQDPVHQISIVPRGMAGGYTLSLPGEDKTYVTKREMNEDIVTLLGGRVAEKLVLDDISTGASNDIERATKVARNMVVRYGFSEKLGPIVYGHDDNEVFLGRDFSSTPSYSETVAAEIDAEIREIIDTAYERAVDILTEHMGQLHEIAKYLFENEKMDEKTFADMMAGKNTVNLEKSADSTEQDSAQTAVSVEEAADEAGQDPTV